MKLQIVTHPESNGRSDAPSDCRGKGKGDGIISVCVYESRGGTCKSIRNQGEQCPWVVVSLNPVEDTLGNRR